MVTNRDQDVDNNPDDVVESRVIELWSELLDSSQVDANSDLFELGGDSLLAMRLVARVNSEFNVSLPWAVFLREANVRALVEEIKEARKS